MHGPPAPPSREEAAPPCVAGLKGRGMVIVQSREITNHAGQQLPPPDPQLPPHPSRLPSQRRCSWLDLAQKRSFCLILSLTQWALHGQSEVGGTPWACWIHFLQPLVLRNGVRNWPGPTGEGRGCHPSEDCKPQERVFYDMNFGLGATQATSTPLTSLLRWLVQGRQAHWTHCPLCSPLHTSEAKLSQAGRGSLGQGRKASTMLILVPVSRMSSVPCPMPPPALPCPAYSGTPRATD